MKITLLLVVFVSVCEAIITLENNGYKNVLVAISDNVPDEPALIENIKELFIAGSEQLYRKFKGRAFFQNVTILVPESWSLQPYYIPVSTQDRFSQAKIRVDLLSGAFGNRPYTSHPGTCGEEGLYIHFTPEFLRGINNFMVEEFGGSPGVLLVHEWLHVRYGVFDEYSDSDSIPFYIGDDAQIHPTGCPDGIKGVLATNNGDSCTLGENGLPANDCHFYPENRNSTSSIMDSYYYDNAELCSESGESSIQHNAVAPTKQNLVCGGRSAWSIVKEHPDFAGGRNPPRLIKSTRPTFRIMQARSGELQRFVLLLDLSYSMKHHRMQTLYKSSTRFIRDQLPVGSRLSIVSFSNDSVIELPLTTVTDATREAIVRRLPRVVHKYGHTSIGKGLITAMQVLDYTGGSILLITDGEENIRPYAEDVLEEIQDAEIVVDTIAYGNNASTHLETLAEATGGKSFYIPDEPLQITQSSTFDAAFFESFTHQSDRHQRPIQIMNRRHILAPNETQEGVIFIDTDVGNNTKVVVTSDIIQPSLDVRVVLFSPNGTEYGPSKGGAFKKDTFTRTMLFTIEDAQEGSWRYIIVNKANVEDHITLSVFTQPKTNRNHPITVRSWINNVDLTYPAYVNVYSEVMKGYERVLNAHVEAIVDRPNRHSVPLTLTDDGKGADNNANDGIYSGTFFNFSGDGRYAVTSVVTGTNDTVLLKGFGPAELTDFFDIPMPTASYIFRSKHFDFPGSVLKASSSFDPESLRIPSPGERTMNKRSLELVTAPLGNFTRFTLGGTFQIKGYSPGKDKLPPARVIDLKVEKVSTLNKHVYLTWTAPGDDLHYGRAKRYELRYLNNSSVLRNFFSAILLNEAYLVGGSLKPVQSGSTQKVKIKFKSREVEGQPVFFALQSWDNAGNPSSISNVATAYFPRRKRRNIHSRHDGVSGGGPGWWGGLVTFLLLLAFIAVGFIAAVVSFVSYRKNRRRKYVLARTNELEFHV